MQELRQRAAHIAVELRELQKQLATQGYCPQQVVQDRTTMELIRELKSGVDAMRQILWKYIDSTAAGCPSRTDSRLLNDATAMLKSLSALNVQEGQGQSFVETVNAVVDKHTPFQWKVA